MFFSAVFYSALVFIITGLFKGKFQLNLTVNWYWSTIFSIVKFIQNTIVKKTLLKLFNYATQIREEKIKTTKCKSEEKFEYEYENINHTDDLEKLNSLKKNFQLEDVIEYVQDGYTYLIHFFLEISNSIKKIIMPA